MNDDYYEDFYLEDLEPLLRDVDVLGSPGIFWTIVGTAAMLSLFAVTAIWRLYYRLKS